jgi:hypothetical protein
VREDVPGTGHWIEFRGPDELNIGDVDAYNSAFEEVFAETASAGMAVSDDGLTMSQGPVRPVITVDHLRRRRDAVLGRVITGWSFGVPLPYTAEKREDLPAAAVPALLSLYKTVTDAIDGLEGPKAQTETGSTSASTSAVESASGLPDSTPEPSATAAG